jgi:putative membrane protein
MDYLSVKALHIIFVVTWFAGLFYIPRLFIYQTEALAKEEPERSILHKNLSLMTKRLWFIITWPSAIITLILGVWTLVLEPSWLKLPFMHIKLTFVFVLYLYHLSLQYIYRLLQKGIVKYTSTQLRIWNEVATIILIAVVFLIVKKDQLSWLGATLGILGVAVSIALAVNIYKRYREKNQ